MKRIISISILSIVMLMANVLNASAETTSISTKSLALYLGGPAGTEYTINSPLTQSQTITISSKLIGKKLQGSDGIVSTRPRCKLINVTKEVETPLGDVNAVRKHVGIMDIVNHMAGSSGIDKDMRDATDLPTAIKERCRNKLRFYRVSCQLRNGHEPSGKR